MAIRLVTGLPGAGKSYYAVHHIIKNYCIAHGDTYVLKDNIVLITNVIGLSLDSHSLKDLIKKVGSAKKFFTVEHQQKVVDHFKDKSIVYVIDEAQDFFDRKFYSRPVFGFFETHRHFGLDVWLISQNANLLARDLLSLVEFEVRATPRTLSMLGFTYNKRSQGQKVGREVLKKDKKVFALYSSQQADELEVVRTPYFKYVGLLVLFVFVGVIIFQLTLAGWGKAAVPEQSVYSDGIIQPASIVKEVKIPVQIILRRVNFVNCNGQLQLYDWSLKQFVPYQSFTYPLILDRSSSRLVIFAEYPVSDFESEEL